MSNSMRQDWQQICFEAMLEYIPEDFTTAEITERFRSVAEHIDVIGSYLQADTTTNDSIAKYYSMAGIGHKEISNYETALDYYFISVSIRKRNNNEEALGLVYNNIAVIYTIKAMYKSALEYSHKSIEISEKFHVPQVELIISYNNLTSLYLQCSSYDKALEWNAKALKTAEESELADNPIIADVHIMRAAIHYANEQFDEALTLDFKALNILKRHYPEEHTDIGAAYNSIARENFSLKHYDTALEYYLMAHKIYKTVYGEDDSDTAEVCGSIAKTYMALENYNCALEWCLKALKTQRKVLGNENPETILRHSFLSEIYERLELYDDAIDHLLIILDYYAKVEEVKIIQIISERIADDYELLNNPSEADKYRKMALEAGERNE